MACCLGSNHQITTLCKVQIIGVSSTTQRMRLLAWASVRMSTMQCCAWKILGNTCTKLLRTDTGEVMKHQKSGLICLLKLWPCGFKIKYTHLGFALARAVWLCIWNSDHVVLNFNTRTSVLPWQQRSYWGLRVTKDAYFSLLTRTKQLLLVTFCDTLAGIEVSFWTEKQKTEEDGWTDRRGSWNSCFDF